MDDKSVYRGNGIFKLISTYNNGNIYGVCMILLLPIYNICEPRRFRRGLFKLSMLLTLSRSVWLGFLFEEVFYLIMIQRERRWQKMMILFCFFTISLCYLIFQLGFSFEFLFDKTLGNRIDQIEYFFSSDLFSSEGFTNLFEIVYMGILKNFGWMGLVFFLLGTIGPLWIHFLSCSKRKYSICEKAFRLSLISYLFVALGDGAILYIPTMAIYWFIASFLQKKNLQYQLPQKFALSMKPKSLRYSRFSLT